MYIAYISGWCARRHVYEVAGSDALELSWDASQLLNAAFAISAAVLLLRSCPDGMHVSNGLEN